MSDPTPTRSAPASPPLSSAAGGPPQEALLQRGAFEPPVTPGTLGRLGRFEILRLIGEGGMGQVYLAREPLTDTQVAIKIVKPAVSDDPQTVHRFLTEARHMYRLSHPRILRVLEVSDRKECPYYVMPYIDGGSLLMQYRTGQPLVTERALAVARQVAEALSHAHNHGLIHRDLKPGNVLLDKEGNAYLTDFGLVRTVFNDSVVDAAASHLEGTAPYMSPAVARGEAEDTRCDIYAFGALLYEMLTGEPPYSGRTVQLILKQIVNGPPPAVHTINPKASPALTRIAEGCMARELRDRYATMADVVADLGRAAQGKSPQGPHPKAYSLSRHAVALLCLFALVVACGIASRYVKRNARTGKPQAAAEPEMAPPQAPASMPVAIAQPMAEPEPAFPQARTSVPVDIREASAGPAAWWQAEGDALDAIGKHHGKLSYVTFEEGKIGKAFRFTGSVHSYVAVEKVSALTLQRSDFTIALWVSFGTAHAPQMIMSCGDRGVDGGKWFLWKEGNSIRWNVNVAKAGGRLFGKGDFTPGNTPWRHLAVVRRNNRYSLHLDGTEIWSAEWQADFPNLSAPLVLGKGEGFGFDGRLDDIRIYGRALQSEEVVALYTGATITAANPGAKDGGQTHALGTGPSADGSEKPARSDPSAEPLQAALPEPNIRFLRTEDYSTSAGAFTRFRFEVTNWKDYPNDLFVLSPHLPPCGLNTNASRTWVEVYADERQVYGFAGFTSPQSLNSIWFAVRQNEQHPAVAHIVLRDRQTGKAYRSNAVRLPVAPTDASATPAGQAFSEKVLGIGPGQ